MISLPVALSPSGGTTLMPRLGIPVGERVPVEDTCPVLRLPNLNCRVHHVRLDSEEEDRWHLGHDVGELELRVRVAGVVDADGHPAGELRED